METLKYRTRSRNPLPWIVIGGIVAPIVILLLSHLWGNPELREIPVLLLIPVVGAMVGWGIYAINPMGKPRGLRKPILVLLAMLVYFMAAAFGYIITRLGGL